MPSVDCEPGGGALRRHGITREPLVGVRVAPGDDVERGRLAE